MRVKRTECDCRECLPSRPEYCLKRGESDDFRSFAALGGPDCEAPFFAPVKESG